ncbi:MAG: hypothetical protein Q8L76_10775 [Cypionkella sp.]|nr:hypothetical protein [Cypionkella sp.]
MGFPHSSESEIKAHLSSPEFQEGVIYDCLFDPVVKGQKAEPLRQYISDGDGAPNILYCEPTFTDGMACFDRTVRGGVEVFDLPTYKTIRIATDGSARMQVYDNTYDAYRLTILTTHTTHYTWSCSRGAAYPNGVSVPQPRAQ